MVTVLRGVCCYYCIVWRVVLCGKWMLEEPVVYVGFTMMKVYVSLGVICVRHVVSQKRFRGG